jgi:hypothetical protein
MRNPSKFFNEQSAAKIGMAAFILIFFVCMWKLADGRWQSLVASGHDQRLTQIAGSDNSARHCSPTHVFSPNSEKAQGVVFPRQQKIHAKLIDYRNHKYIVFTLFSVSRGVVHDPDCPCQTVD